MAAPDSSEAPADPASTAVGDGRPPTAGGRGAWVVLGVIVVLLLVTVTVRLVGGSVDADAGAGAGDGGGDVTATTAPVTEGPCSATVDEPLDPNSVVRLLPNAPPPVYASDPPTSGAFEVGPRVSAVSTVELSPPVQVGLLAQGIVLIQHKGLSPAVLTALESLAGDSVVIAPNESLTSAVVATAWLRRQECVGLDTKVLARFITRNANRGPQAGPNGTSPPTTR